jgi:hypothetical protein
LLTNAAVACACDDSSSNANVLMDLCCFMRSCIASCPPPPSQLHDLISPMLPAM